MPIKYLKPLIGLKPDEKINTSSKEQNERVIKAGLTLYFSALALGLAARFGIDYYNDTPLPTQETEQIICGAGFGTACTLTPTPNK